MKRIQDESDLRGKKVLVRVDIDDALVNSFPIRAVLPTLSFLRNAQAKIVLLTHVGRDSHASSEKLFKALQKEITLDFVPDVIGAKARNAISNMKDGDVLLLENIRREQGEIENSGSFARKLAGLADIYVNDAFAVSHRQHASIVGVPKYLPSFAGLRLQEEIKHLSRALSPEHPALFIIGGAKIETKLPLIKKFLELYDTVFIGGALANSFFKAKGLEIGDSIVSESDIDITSLLDNKKIILPADAITKTRDGIVTKSVTDIKPGEKMLDAGEATVAELIRQCAKAKYVLWNGPLGIYEEGYDKSTKSLAQAIADSSAHSIVGGGDTASAIVSLSLEEKFSFLSTGGGAMLQFLLEGTLPGIEVLR
ncbi:phosphoglycerate kinase [Candidatus Kaiserbacteria bacterium]|nr:phosphoglycerate kinase [Candidatus Kaiserbacteria bacterium]